MEMVLWRETRLPKKVRDKVSLLDLYLAWGQRKAIRVNSDGLAELLPGVELQRVDVEDRTRIRVLIPRERHEKLRLAYEGGSAAALARQIANHVQDIRVLKAAANAGGQRSYDKAVKKWAGEEVDDG